MKSPHFKFLLIAGICVICFSESFTQSKATPEFQLFLIGDAGDDDTTGATLLDLKEKLHNKPNSAVIFLGDNCYSNFFLRFINIQAGGYDGSKEGRRRLMSQINILRDYKGSAYFIPGNHDWWNKLNLKKGKKRLLEEAVFIEDTLMKMATVRNSRENTFLPSLGSPGPVFRELNEGKIRIIFIDTYRLIIEESNKKNKDTILLHAFYQDLKNQLTDAAKKQQKIFIVGHHPVYAKGNHSQAPKLIERLFRRFGNSNTNYPPYKMMANRLDSLMKEQHHPAIYYVSGHEHSLEYFFTDSIHYLVSGAGSKVDKIPSESYIGLDECLQWNEAGYFEIDFYKSHQTILMHHRKDNEHPMEVTCIAGCK